jgi:hypothetical protein
VASVTTRRLLAVVIAGAIAAAGLAGCRSAPGIAAYLGDAEITEARITKIFDDAHDKLVVAVKNQATASGQPVPEKIEMPISRRDVVVAVVGRDIFKSAADAKGAARVEVDAAQVAQQLQLPSNTEYVTIYSDYLAYRGALSQDLSPKTPTEADLRDVYQRLAKSGGVPPETSFAEFTSGLQGQNLQLVTSAVTIREEVASQAAKARIVVNPRYAPAELDLLSFADQQGKRHPLVVLPLNSKSADPAVVDAG